MKAEVEVMRQDSPDRLQRQAIVFCLLTGAIWGFGFIATSQSLSAFGAFQVLLIRFAGAAALAWIPVLTNRKSITRQSLTRGVVCGLFLFGAFALQTLGLDLTEAGSNAFFTSANVVLVPFLAWAVFRKPPALRQFGACLLCFAGIGLMGWTAGGFSLRTGDLLSLGCALLFACHIVSLQWAAGQDPDVINAIQMSVAALLSAVPGLSVRWPAHPGLLPVLSLVYLIAGSTWLAFWLQTRAQEHLEASRASLLLATESLWANLFAVIFLKERLSPAMAAGGLLILTAVYLTEQPASVRKTASTTEPSSATQTEEP